MGLVKWEPRGKVAPFMGLREEVDRLFDDFLHGWPSMGLPEPGRGAGFAFMPSVNIREEEKEYFLDVDVPGMAKEDLKVKINELSVTIEGERKEERKESSEEKGYYLMESSYGSFRRVVPLPEPIMADKAEAKMKDGVLKLRLPKARPHVEQAVEIKVE